VEIGIGYTEYRNLYESVRNEKPGDERFLVYFGRAHITDHLTGVMARGPLKIGRGKFATAIMRGRNQPGVDFRIYSEIIFRDNETTYDCENLIKFSLEHLNIKMSQNQQELYDILDEELKHTVETMVEIIKAEYPWAHINEVNHYFDLDDHQPNNKITVRTNNTLEMFF
jgi:hypothetical protein